MLHLESVTPTYGNRSHWVARITAPFRLEWDATITDEEKNKNLRGVLFQGQMSITPVRFSFIPYAPIAALKSNSSLNINRRREVLAPQWQNS